MPVVTLAIVLFLSWSQTKPAGHVTWSRGVARIVYQHCSSCHRPGQPAPFPLLAYEDSRKMARLIASVVEAGYMPPWKPAPGFGRFAGARGLNPAEIAAITQWVRDGAPSGNLGSAPRPPDFSTKWELGKPDAVVSLAEGSFYLSKEGYEVDPDGPDQYRCFVIPAPFERDVYVRAFEFAPGSGSVIHHALMFVDARRAAPNTGPYDCFGTPGFLPSAGLGGWTPGSRAVEMPVGTAVRVPRGARIVMQLHFHPTGKRETVSPELALYIQTSPPTRYLMDVPLGSHDIDIAPGNRRYRVRDHFEIPVPVEVTGVIPHAHYLCRDMKAWAELPGGGRRWLLWIKDWDFNWQEQYRYAPPFTLPAGTDIRMEFTYDNSDANIRNPKHPPERVVWGPSSADEMAGLHLQVIPRNDEEMHELGRALWGKVMRGVGGSFYRLPQVRGPTY